MSELINNRDNRAAIRWKLLASVSGAALIASAVAQAADSDTDRPLIWIELGSQLERASGGDSPYVSPFFSHIDAPIQSPATIEKELPWSLGPEAKISFQPEGSDWIFSAAIRYGRAKNSRSTQQVSNPPPYQHVHAHQLPGGGEHFKCCYTETVIPSLGLAYADTQSGHQESHTVLDFQAGKDVGLGLFGSHGTSVLNAGVRFAQFTAKLNASVKARTDLQHYNRFDLPIFAYSHNPAVTHYPQKYKQGVLFHGYSQNAASARSFRAVGPSISWDASAALAGTPETSELTFDWGINAALLFGRQKTKTSHDAQGHALTNVFYTTSGYHEYHKSYVQLYSHPRVSHTRSRRVTVPNVGGMAGFSIKFSNAKVSIGYRADVFFGAMDGGWDMRKSENRSFMGPVASISFGLGD